MITIIMRHGEAEHNVRRIFDSDTISKMSLTKNGIETTVHMGRILAHRLKNSHEIIEEIYSSPLLRAYETALWVRKMLLEKDRIRKNCRIVLDYDLREIGMGRYEGLSVDDYPDGHWNFDNNDRYGGESEDEVFKRVDRFSQRIYGTKNVLVVTHGTPMQCMMQSFFPTDPFFDDFRPNKSQMVSIDIMEDDLVYNLI